MRRLFGILAAGLLTVAGLFASSTPAQAQASAPPQAPVYTALGDSYAAGYGLPSKSDAASIACGRSNLSYPELLNGFSRLKHMDFAACSGATVYDVVTSQMSAVTARTTTVTVTIGGNDAGFSQLTCLTAGTCDLQQIAATSAAAIAALAGGPSVTGTTGDPVVPLATLYADIHAIAPHARILVTGYPKLFGTSADVYGTSVACPIPRDARTSFTQLATQLDAVISGSATTARSAGIDVTFVGVTSAFSGHGICDTRTPFVSSVLHPTALGQAAYASALILKGVAW